MNIFALFKYKYTLHIDENKNRPSENYPRNHY